MAEPSPVDLLNLAAERSLASRSALFDQIVRNYLDNIRWLNGLEPDRKPLTRWERLKYGPLYDIPGRVRHAVANCICPHEDCCC